jgi:hypothetical protein
MPWVAAGGAVRSDAAVPAVRMCQERRCDPMSRKVAKGSFAGPTGRRALSNPTPRHTASTPILSRCRATGQLGTSTPRQPIRNAQLAAAQRPGLRLSRLGVERPVFCGLARNFRDILPACEVSALASLDMTGAAIVTSRRPDWAGPGTQPVPAGHPAGPAKAHCQRSG